MEAFKMNFAEIIYDKSDRIATITFNRPEKMNAYTPKMGAETRTAMIDADRDPNIRAIIVTGAGRAYCAGADMGNLSDISTGRASATSGPAIPPDQEEWLRRLPEDYRNQYAYVLGLSKPVIGAINGACVGLGFTTSLYHDIRIASDNARMGLIFVQRGLAIEHGSSWMLPRIIGVSRAAELAVTGRLVDAEEALRIGLVHRVVPQDKLMATAREVAGQIANNCAPLGVAEAKRMIWRHQFTDLGTAIRDNDEAIVRMTRSDDFKEGIRAFIEKRPAKYQGK
jgi:enoyl-CoA hydratase/carnithine racemase